LKGLLYFLAICFLGAALSVVPLDGAAGQDVLDGSGKTGTAQVLFDGKEVFTVGGAFGPYSPGERATIIGNRIDELADDDRVDVAKVEVREDKTGSQIFVGGRIVTTITDDDARTAGLTRAQLARQVSEKVRRAIVAYRQSRSVKAIALTIGIALLMTALLVFLLKVTQRLKIRLIERVLGGEEGLLHQSIHFQDVEFLSRERLHLVTVRIIKLSSLAAYGLLIYFYLFGLFSVLPWTRPYADRLSSYVFSPVATLGKGLLSQLPNIVAIIVIGLVARYVLKGVAFFFDEMRKGTIHFEGFYPDWIDPTYKLVRLLVLILAAVVIFPYIPGSESPVFKGISIFVGVLFSLGSSSAVSNIIAGLLITYTRAFKVGDRIRVGDQVGDVTEKTLFVTRLKTIKNETVSIPNGTMISSNITNYTELAEAQGLILHSAVTIGYDAPWRTVHRLLKEAALATGGILGQPEPFVLQTSLDDFYVTYEINAYTVDPRDMVRIYSNLHQNIQDRFNEEGVEIMSPHYRQVRDGNQTTIPGQYLDEKYEAPRFRVDVRPAGEGKDQEG
jgi:small-conductance mechanosensitive channel